MRYEFPFPGFEANAFRIMAKPFFKIFLGRFERGSFISPLAKVDNMKKVYIGHDCHIGRRTLISPIKQYRGSRLNSYINIGSRVYVGNYCTLSTSQAIVIGDDVTIGDHVYIGGGRHGYEDPDAGALEQPLVLGSVEIGCRAWIGYGSFIAGVGALTIGEHAIIGANSVVTKSVPDFTVVAGAPARPIKRFDHASKGWVSVRPSTSG